jgi:hypothetical protein
MALGLTQSLTEMSTRNIHGGGGGKGGRCVELTTLPPSCADCLEIWEPQTPGTPRAWNGIALLFTISMTANHIYTHLKHSAKRINVADI